MSHLLVVANETVTGPSLIEAVKQRDPELVTVLAPVSHPHEGYVVYEDTRRASAGRRLDRTLQLLREAGIPASGQVVDADPVNATRDAIALAMPDQILHAPDCAGLCPVCGKDLNVEPHTHADEVLDPRWSALEELRDRL